MTAYDAQLYTFLTKPENFEPLVDLREQFDKVRQRLINEFWALVLEEASRLKPAGMLWVFTLDDANAPNRKLRANHPDITNKDFKAGIIYEFLHMEVVLGAWFNRDMLKDAIYNIWAEAKKFTEGNPLWTVGSGSWWFAIYKRPGLNLSQKASLLQVLPDVRASLATAYAEQFISAVDQLGPFCLEQAKKL